MKNETPTTIQSIPKDDELSIIPKIQHLIKSIRGKQVILDSNLAQLYQVETKHLNRQVKRNFERFPEDFMFQLNKDECSRYQIGTLNINNEDENLKCQLVLQVKTNVQGHKL